ncbi:ABC transporter ATP-binding protein [Actinosynnema pretiosum subsp. pretiosum]|uniref:ABC transporter related n=2 Tax=Actinosynnema TaxID=40566 RepID=C6WFF3_ACTMD|nr:ABC transporter ATP-binding protein [Actinosynnema mirum]ACU35888.1 ABC transporter related [Actinosynnema mirum DSM 43827]QUF06433.1 ABC transporter ATP-binding protein [Actinosynnema pretiosum subsp. pretiosum]
MATTTAPAAVSLRGVRKSRGAVRAVDGVDLVVAPGEVVALLGPNGAGKSTTVDVLLGLTAPDAGEVRLFGRTPRQAVVDGLVGAVLQDGALLEGATVGEVVGLVAALHRRPLPVAEALALAGATDLARRRSTELSGGQRKRALLATALVPDPDLLVLDEPTAALDVQSRRRFWATTREHTARGRTVLFATHHLEEAQEFADRVVLLDGGKVIADGTVAQIRTAVSGRVIAATLPGASAPGADLAPLRALPGVRAVETRGDRVLLECADSDAALRALLATHPTTHDVEVTALGLEAAFLALTGRENR